MPEIIPDPRPDLSEDTDNWCLLLQIARFEDKTVFETLKGFRVAGCRLYVGASAQEGMVFNFGTEVSEDDKKIIKKHAQLHKTKINDLFKRVFIALRNHEKSTGRKENQVHQA